MAMKDEILGRYARGPANEIVIDVDAIRVADLYENFDRRAPYIRRDLDSDLVEYLTGCARELGNHPFSIRFTFQELPDPNHLVRIRRSLKGFFAYLREVERNKIHRRLRSSLVLGGVGLTLLSFSVWVNQAIGIEQPLVKDVFAEGITIAAWVAMWQAFATYLIEWVPARLDIRLYGRLSQAPLLFGNDTGNAAHRQFCGRE
jgi:hypothetical protein